MDTARTSTLYQLMDSACHLAIAAVESARSDDGWTPATILGHVSDVDEQVWNPRIRLIVNAFHKGIEGPSLTWWEPDAQATELKYRAVTLEHLIARLFSTRAAIIETLSQLNDEEWRGSALHDSFGRITITDLPEKILLHDDEHLESLR
jgi:hypothetical protein